MSDAGCQYEQKYEERVVEVVYVLYPRETTAWPASENLTAPSDALNVVAPQEKSDWLNRQLENKEEPDLFFI